MLALKGLQICILLASLFHANVRHAAANTSYSAHKAAQ